MQIELQGGSFDGEWADIEGASCPRDLIEHRPTELTCPYCGSDLFFEVGVEVYRITEGDMPLDIIGVYVCDVDEDPPID